MGGKWQCYYYTPCFVTLFIQPLVQFWSIPTFDIRLLVFHHFLDLLKAAVPDCEASLWRCTEVTELYNEIKLLFGDIVRNLQNTCIIMQIVTEAN